MTKVEIALAISDMESKLNATLASIRRGRGPVEEALSMMIPMLQDQLRVLRSILSLLENKDG